MCGVLQVREPSEMKRIVLFLLFIAVELLACSGDCRECHAKLALLEQEPPHKVLASCKRCHTKEQMENTDMGGMCGGDCWQCHDIKKVAKSGVVAHKALSACKKCHFKSVPQTPECEELKHKPSLLEMIRKR